MRVFLADGDPLFRALVRFDLHQDPSIRTCEADDGHSAYQKIRFFRPNLLIVATELNVRSGIQLLKKLRGEIDSRTVTVLLSSAEASELPQSVRDMVDVVFYKHELAKRLPVLIRNIRCKSRWIPPRIWAHTGSKLKKTPRFGEN